MDIEYIRFQIGETTGRRQRVLVRCGACDFEWVAAYLPMELTEFAERLGRLTCPDCRETADNIHAAPPEPPILGAQSNA